MGQGIFSRLRPASSGPELVTSEPHKRKAGQDYDHLVKLMLIGDSDLNCTPTIGIDFKLRTIDVEERKIKLQLLDTAGQERFKTITTAHYRNAHGIMLVYDVTNEESFRHIEEWLKNIDQHTMGPVNKILIGNKADLKSQRKITTEQGKKLADTLGMAFHETSAKDRLVVDEAFLDLTRQVKERMTRMPKSSTSAQQNSKSQSSKSAPCLAAESRRLRQ